MSEAVHPYTPVADAAPSADVSTLAQPSRTRRYLRRAWRGAVVVLAGYYVVCLALLVTYRVVAPPVTGVQLERRVESWFSAGAYAQTRRWTPNDRIPRHVARAVVAAEDGKFWTHKGFDFEQMKIAGMVVFDGEMPRGASTITQQLMKNLFGTTSQNPVRKLLDLSLTIPAELMLGKERILELYLNNVEWGPGIFGVESAARYHYGVGVQSLSRSEAAGLAALLPNPRQRTIANTPKYRSEILRRMAHRGW